MQVIYSNNESSKERKSVLIEVRGNRENEHYLFPKKEIEKTIKTIKASKIYCDDIPADSKVCNILALHESKFSVEDYSESEVIALNSGIDIKELYEVIDYINSHPNEYIRIRIFLNSELPEFKEVLNKDIMNLLPKEQKSLLVKYMKTLLDLSDSDRLKKIVDYMEQASFGKLLLYYSNDIQNFILENVTKRMYTEIKGEMEDRNQG